MKRYATLAQLFEDLGREVIARRRGRHWEGKPVCLRCGLDRLCCVPPCDFGAPAEARR